MDKFTTLAPRPRFRVEEIAVLRAEHVRIVTSQNIVLGVWIPSTVDANRLLIVQQGCRVTSSRRGKSALTSGIGPSPAFVPNAVRSVVHRNLLQKVD